MSGAFAIERLERAGGTVVDAGRRVVRQSLRDDVLGLSAELSYHFFLALFPFAIFVTTLGGSLAGALPIENPAQRAVEVLGDVLPQEAAALVEGQLEAIIDGSSAGLLSIGAVLALFFATGGTNAIIKAMNRTYSVPESRPIWKRYLVALGLTVVSGLGLVAAFTLAVPLRILGPQIASAIGLGGISLLLVNVAFALGALTLLVVAAAIVYRVAPNTRLPIKAVLPGAFLFALAWMVAAFGFGIYVSDFAAYANFYGALAGVVVMLLFFYISSLILLVAAEVNEVIQEMAAPDDVEQRRREARESPAGV
ncbi:hypothetical protein BH24CHL5_BH24CHL5_07490 [soil metagenome]